MIGQAKPIQLEPYDQGYRDGWHDVNVTRWPGRTRRRQRSQEDALGYQHGRVDGAEHPEAPDWWPGYAQSLGNHAREMAFSSSGRAERV